MLQQVVLPFCVSLFCKHIGLLPEKAIVQVIIMALEGLCHFHAVA